MDVPKSQLVIPALSVALLLGLGIVGNPGLGVATDLLTSGDSGGPDAGTASSGANNAAGAGVGPSGTEATDESKDASSDGDDGDSSEPPAVDD